MDRWVHDEHDIRSSLEAKGPTLNLVRARVIPLTVILMTAVVMGIYVGRSMDPEVNGGADRFVATNALIHDQLRCIEEQARQMLPRRAKVVVDGSDVYWAQRLPQAIYPYVEVVSSVEEADLVVGVKQDPDGCSGTSLDIRPT